MGFIFPHPITPWPTPAPTEENLNEQLYILVPLGVAVLTVLCCLCSNFNCFHRRSPQERVPGLEADVEGQSPTVAHTDVAYSNDSCGDDDDQSQPPSTKSKKQPVYYAVIDEWFKVLLKLRRAMPRSKSQTNSAKQRLIPSDQDQQAPSVTSAT
jgi:hypothetical protein